MLSLDEILVRVRNVLDFFGITPFVTAALIMGVLKTFYDRFFTK